MRKMRFYTFCKFLKSPLRPLYRIKYRSIIRYTRAKDDSILICDYISPSHRSGDKPHARAKILIIILIIHFKTAKFSLLHLPQHFHSILYFTLIFCIKTK